MVSAEDVKLADLAKARAEKLRALNAEQAEISREEKARRDKWETDHWAREGAVRAAQADLEKSGEAALRIRLEVPAEVLRTESQAGSALRANEENVTRARQEYEAAESVLERRREEEKARSGKIEKWELESLMKQVAERDAVYAAEKAKRSELEQAAAKATAAIEREVQRIRKAALAADEKKAAGASRG